MSAISDVTASINDLIAEATALVEHRTGDVVAMALVRDELAAAIACCEDTATAADGNDVLVTLERVLRTSDHWRHLPLAS